MKLKAAPAYLVEEDSDDYGAMSSDEEEVEDPLLGNELMGDEASDQSDEFEKEMDAEIRQSMSISLPVSVTAGWLEFISSCSDSFKSWGTGGLQGNVVDLLLKFWIANHAVQGVNRFIAPYFPAYQWNSIMN